MSTSRRGTQIDHATVIRKMFALEARKGFQDTAVSGGFERYFAGLERQSGNISTEERWISPLASLFDGYSELDPDARKDRLQRARAILESSNSTVEPRSRSACDFGVRTEAETGGYDQAPHQPAYAS